MANNYTIKSANKHLSLQNLYPSLTGNSSKSSSTQSQTQIAKSEGHIGFIMDSCSFTYEIYHHDGYVFCAHICASIDPTTHCRIAKPGIGEEQWLLYVN